MSPIHHISLIQDHNFIWICQIPVISKNKSIKFATLCNHMSLIIHALTIICRTFHNKTVKI